MPKFRSSSTPYTRETREEEVKVKKYLLIHAAQKLIERQKPGPSNDWLIVALTTFVAMSFTFATATFRDRIFSSYTWEAFALLVLVASVVGIVFLGYRYVRARQGLPAPMTPEQFYEELCKQMDEDERRVEELEEKAAKEAAALAALKPAKQPAFDPDKVDPDEIPF